MSLIWILFIWLSVSWDERSGLVLCITSLFIAYQSSTMEAGTSCIPAAWSRFLVGFWIFNLIHYSPIILPGSRISRHQDYVENSLWNIQILKLNISHHRLLFLAPLKFPWKISLAKYFNPLPHHHCTKEEPHSSELWLFVNISLTLYKTSHVAATQDPDSSCSLLCDQRARNN